MRGCRPRPARGLHHRRVAAHLLSPDAHPLRAHPRRRRARGAAVRVPRAARVPHALAPRPRGLAPAARLPRRGRGAGRARLARPAGVAARQRARAPSDSRSRRASSSCTRTTWCRAGVSKTQAIAIDLAERGLSASQAAAIGDSVTDLAMADGVGLMALVDNAFESAQRAEALADADPRARRTARGGPWRRMGAVRASLADGARRALGLKRERLAIVPRRPRPLPCRAAMRCRRTQKARRR